jgi:hypothetical protein
MAAAAAAAGGGADAGAVGDARVVLLGASSIAVSLASDTAVEHRLTPDGDDRHDPAAAADGAPTAPAAGAAAAGVHPTGEDDAEAKSANSESKEPPSKYASEEWFVRKWPQPFDIRRDREHVLSKGRNKQEIISAKDGLLCSARCAC